MNPPQKKKHSNEEPLTYVLTNNKNNSELFTEITKNLEQLINNGKIKNILDKTKIIKSKRQPKNVKHTLTLTTFGEHTTHGNSECKNKRYEYVI